MPGELFPIRRVGRPRKLISPEVQNIILTLISTGDSDRAVKKITGIQPREWRAYADEDGNFASLLEKAIESRSGGLASMLRQAMIRQIKAGHPWWAKLAIHNFKTGLRDPDVMTSAKLKRILGSGTVEPEVTIKMRPVPADEKSNGNDNGGA